MTDAQLDHCSVSIVIKALNEERNICAAIETSLAALAKLDGEVVLADSCSSDSTVELASRYPIKVVQLAHAHERCCGIGPQLGFQHARGEFIYILDGDMRMAPGFLERALTFLAQHPEVGGVGGRLIELNHESLEYRERAARNHAHLQPGEVDRLDGGGLYRRIAIEEAGYLSDRNLHGYEEYDLGVRLRALGWKLWRLPIASATHFGHDAPPYALLVRRWRSRYVCGVGELLRGAVGRRHLKLALRGLREVRLYAAVLVGWALLASIPFWPLALTARAASFALLALAPFAAMTWRKGSPGRAVHSIISWCFNAAGLLRGFLRPRVPPASPIASIVVHEPPQSLESRQRQRIA